MLHRKNIYADTVSFCKNFLENKCNRNGNECWFKHEKSNNMNNPPQVFQMAMEGQYLQRTE